MSPMTKSTCTTRAALAACLLALLAACSSEGGAADARDVDAVRARARAMAYTVSTEPKWDLARAEIAPLLEVAEPEPLDLLRGALIAYHQFDLDAAKALVERAAPDLPDNLSVPFLQGLILRDELYYDEAIAKLEEVLAADPSDLGARVTYGFTLEYADRLEEAIEQFQQIRALGIEANVSIYVTATYRASQDMLRVDRTPEGRARAMELNDEYEALLARGLEAMDVAEVQNSGYGAVPGPVPFTVAPGAPRVPDLPALTPLEGTDVVSLPGHEYLAAIDVDADGDRDLLAWGAGGAAVVLQDDGVWIPITIADTATVLLAAADLDESAEKDLDHPHPPLELLAIDAEGSARLFTWNAGEYVPLGPGVLGASGVRDGVFVDHDHDGDTDVVLATVTGVGFFRNDGTAEQSARTLVADPVGEASLGPIADVVTEDVDGDEDVDIVALHDDGSVRLLSNERRHRWRDVSADWRANAVRATPGGLHLADLDGDGVTDWLAVDESGGLTWHRGLGAGVFGGEAIATSGVTLDAPQLVDVDADGRLDLYQDGLVLAGPLVRRDAPIAATPFGTAAAGVVSDLDGDAIADVATLDASGALAIAAGEGGGQAATIVLDGRKDNRNGIGAIVDVYAGLSYQRIYARGDALTIGLGESDGIDALRIVWPNGVPQRGPLDIAAGDRVLIEQTEGPPGSCPFLYTWNGETFTFITDVLGTTPLGLPIAPGVQVPFDHEEYVLVRGDQLVPRDGRLDIAITEELREVTYLDHLRLHAIDHPAEIEVQPNEGFVFPPFPPHHVHTLRDLHAPASARSIDGTDITEFVAFEDGQYGAVFERELTQYYGLTKPWTLDLDFSNVPADALADAETLRLVITGWFWWADASVNMAAARHPTISFDVPQLWVPDASAPSGWRAAGPPIGFPAGKTKTQVIDVTDLLVRDDPRLRITSTLALSYDALRLAIDADDAPYVDTPLPALTADVTWRGFSRPFRAPDGGPELFDWDELDDARWDQHPGKYTRYGDVATLLDEVDDRTVIFGAGDVVYASFDATALPELPDGWTRTYLIYFDGWAKDRDPNTIAAERVEPLPFHGMTTYPPERPFPSSPALDAWRDEYNTRPAKRLRHPHPAVEQALLDVAAGATTD